MARRIRYHYHRPGRGDTVYDETLVVDRPDLMVTLLDAYDGREVREGTEVLLERGSPIVWFVFPGAWHDVGRFHRADGTFTGWYTNLCTPVEVTPEHWSCTDLFLDLWQPADGPARWLDEEEFVLAVDAGLVNDRLAARARAERDAIAERLNMGGWPPAPTRVFDLARVRALIATE